MSPDSVKAAIRTVKDFPQPGIRFRDVTTLFEAPEIHRWIIQQMADWVTTGGYEALAGIDARGFLLAGAVAEKTGLPLVLVRKKGKLPADTLSVDYQLEYGSATVEVHKTDKLRGRRTLILDDLLATGGTALAAVTLIRQLEAAELGFGAIINLVELPGYQALEAAAIRQHYICEFTENE